MLLSDFVDICADADTAEHSSLPKRCYDTKRMSERTMKSLAVVFLMLISSSISAVEVLADSSCACDGFRLKEVVFFQAVLAGDRAKMQSLYEKAQTESSSSALCALYTLNMQAQLAFFDGHVDSARALIELQVKKLDELQCEKKSYVFAERQLGYFCFQQGDVEESVRHMLRVADLSAAKKDTAQQLTALMNVTTILNSQGEYARAIEILDKVQSLVDPKMHRDYYGNVAEAYLNTYKSEYDRTKSPIAKQRYFEWVDLNLEYNRHSEAIVNRVRAYHNAALAASMKQEFSRSILYADSALALAPGKFPPVLLSANYTMRAAAYAGLEHHAKAQAYGDSALRIAYLSGHPETILSAQDAVYEVAKAAGNFKQALTALEQKMSLKDSIENKERAAKIRSLELKYNKAKDAKTIKEMEQQQEIGRLNNRFLIAALVAVVLIGIVLLVLYRQRDLKHKQTILETEQRLNRARMNPHFFFNALTSLQSYSLKPGNGERVSQYLSKYSRIMRHTLESTYNDVITLEEELEYLTGYLEIESMRSSVPFVYSIDIDQEIDPSETMIPPMILQPFIENSIEHGFRDIDYEGVIQLSFIYENNMLCISISDNGTSTTNEQHKGYPSRATQIIRDRLFLLNQKTGSNARFEIRNTDSRGYTVIVTLPILQTA